MELAPGTVIDRYEVETVLGEGGMARVFRARHTGLGTLHAVKLLTTTTPHIRQRLLQEGRVQASLKHPNIVSVHDIIEIDGAPGLVMEYVDGPTLGALLAHGHFFTEAQLDALALALFDAVEHAHGVQVVHRDLKPANVLLARDHKQVVPKITDFGLAKLLTVDRRDSATRSGVAMGTPAYMAPEQIRDAKYVGPPADLWSLGAILFELVTQTRAFAGDDVFEIYRRVVEGDRPPVAELAEASERMIAAIDAALVVDVADRVASVEALRALWTEGMPAHDGPVWDAGELERIGALGHGGKPWSVSESAGLHSARSARGSKSEETLVLSDATIPDPVPAPLPVTPAPPEPAGRPSPAVLGAVGLAVVAVVGLAWALWRTDAAGPAKPAPESVVATPPHAPAEAPTPVAEEPTPPAPVAQPEPEPTPPPAPARPAPTTAPRAAPAPVPAPAPAPETAPAPEPEPAPVPTPAPAAPQASVTVTGFERVHLENVDTGDIAKPGPVPPGRWRVVAMFGGQPTPSDDFDVAEGQQVAVKCLPTMGVCKVQ